jgi:hypothetical protein
MRFEFVRCLVIGLAALSFGRVTVAQVIGNGDGQFTVRAYNLIDGGGSADSDINTVAEMTAVWNFLDTNPGFTTGTTPSIGGAVLNIGTNLTTLSVGFNVPNVIDFNGGGDFGTNNPYSNIAGGAGLGGDDFSVRAQTYVQFNTGGTYTIAVASDDGRQINLSEAIPGFAPGYSGFTARNLQTSGTFTSGDDSIFYDGCCGQTLGTFTVGAGEVLALDTFFHERGGGDYFEVSLAQGSQATFAAGTFQLLTDGMFNGAISLHSAVQLVPEPSMVAFWSLAAVGAIAFYRLRRRA